MTRLPGTLSDIYQKMSPRIYQSWRQLYEALWTEGVLSPSTRELIRLKSAELARCRH